MRQMIAVLLCVLITSCQAVLFPPSMTRPALRGRVEWRQPALRVAATHSDVLATATIALIDPTTKDTMFVARSDANGVYAFDFASFGTALPVGSYWLEATRYIGGTDQAGLTLRTIVEMDALGWRSISGANYGDPVIISPLTTAVARVRVLDSNIFDFDVIGVVTPGNPVPQPVGPYSAQTLQDMATAVEATVAANGDSAGDVSLPLTVTPMVGTAGITLLTWSGFGLATPGLVRQTAVGSDVWDNPQTVDDLGFPVGGGIRAVAPGRMVGEMALRLQIGTSWTLPVTWTAVKPEGQGTNVRKVAVGHGPAGTYTAWFSSGPDTVFVAPTTSSNVIATPQTVALTGTTVSGLAVSSTDATTVHVMGVANNALLHWTGINGVWGAASTIVAGTAPSGVQLTPDGSGGLWAAYLDDSASPRAVRVRHFDGVSWTAAETLGTTAVESFSLAGDAEPHVSWSEDDGAGKHTVYHSQRVAGTWLPPEALSAVGEDATQVSLALNVGGEPSAAWVSETALGTAHLSRRLNFRTYATAAWQPAETVQTSALPYVARPHLLITPDGLPMLSWLQGDFRPMVVFAQRTAPGAMAGAWSAVSTYDTVKADGLVGVEGTGRHWLVWRDSESLSIRGIPLIW